MKQKYFSIREIAEKYGLSVDTIKTWIYRDRTLKAIKVGGAVRIKESDFEEMITKIN